MGKRNWNQGRKLVFRMVRGKRKAQRTQNTELRIRRIILMGLCLLNTDYMSGPVQNIVHAFHLL